MNVPDSWILRTTGRKCARPYKMNAKYNDLIVGGDLYEVPETYWCQFCDGTGCDRCKGTGIARKKDRPQRQNRKRRNFGYNQGLQNKEGGV